MISQLILILLGLVGVLHESFANKCCSLLTEGPGSGRCYITLHDRKHWWDAKYFCNSIGTTLAQPKTQAENEWLLQQTGNVTLWISASDISTEGHWAWQDGPIENFLWHRSEPSNGTQENCAIIKESYKSWGDENCAILYPFVCEACMEGWVKGPSAKCYHIETTNKMNWTDAKEFCNNQGATLAKPKTQEMNEWILEETGHQTYWISATDEHLEGNWTWEDGSAIQNFMWHTSSGQPTNIDTGSGLPEDCGTVRSNLLMWNDDVCSKHYAFACEI